MSAPLKIGLLAAYEWPISSVLVTSDVLAWGFSFTRCSPPTVPNAVPSMTDSSVRGIIRAVTIVLFA